MTDSDTRRGLNSGLCGNSRFLYSFGTANDDLSSMYRGYEFEGRTLTETQRRTLPFLAGHTEGVTLTHVRSQASREHFFHCALGEGDARGSGRSS